MPAALIFALIAAAIGISVPYSFLRFQLRLKFRDVPETNPFLPDRALYDRCLTAIPADPLFRRWRVLYWLIWGANAVFVVAVIVGAATLVYFRWRS
jgi:hypothetical protein